MCIFTISAVAAETLCMYKADQENAHRGAAQLAVRAAPCPLIPSLQIIIRPRRTCSYCPAAAHVAASSSHRALRSAQPHPSQQVPAVGRCAVLRIRRRRVAPPRACLLHVPGHNLVARLDQRRSPSHALHVSPHFIFPPPPPSHHSPTCTSSRTLSCDMPPQTSCSAHQATSCARPRASCSKTRANNRFLPAPP